MKLHSIIPVILFAGLLSCSKEHGPVIPLTGGQEDTDNVPRSFAVVNQDGDRIQIVDRLTGLVTWSWSPAESGLDATRQAWFGLPDEVKPVYDCKYLLITCTRGAVAIIRISDKKLMFYACPKGQPHSAELLPDGRVVTVSSTDGTQYGDKMRIYEVDTLACFASAPLFEQALTFGHNAVWDLRNEVLWATSNDVLNSYTYDATRASLSLRAEIALPDGAVQAHDLFPEYGTRRLWLTTSNKVYQFDTQTTTFTPLRANIVANIKSISSGPQGYETLMLYPNQSYWSDRLIDLNGRYVWQQDGARIYKGRWMLPNLFSYPEKHVFMNSQKKSTL
ncbi:MAG: hypothetical protein IJ721_00930 [Bacteroidales bacterium]|nr:hypothetical protein [Bacteroidales bacterium]